jgi:hypothetical protein
MPKLRIAELVCSWSGLVGSTLDHPTTTGSRLGWKYRPHNPSGVRRGFTFRTEIIVQNVLDSRD